MAVNDSQLIFIIDGQNNDGDVSGGSDTDGDAGIHYVNSADTTTSTFLTEGPFGSNTSLNDLFQVAADTAAGWYFVIDPNFTGSGVQDGTVREGHLGSPTTATTVAYTVPDVNAPPNAFSEAWAMAIDTTNHFVYVSEDTFNGPLTDFGAHTGIVKFSYNPVTGAVGAATDVFVRPTGANNEILSLSLDTANQKLYFVDDSEGSFGTTPSVTNEVEVLNLNTNAVTTLATLPSGAQYFPANTANNQYTSGGIVAVAEDTSDHLTFFSTGTGFNNATYNGLNRIYVVDDHTGGQTPVQLAELASVDNMDPKFMSFDSAHHQLWVSYINASGNTGGASDLGHLVRYDVNVPTPGSPVGVTLINPVDFTLNLAETTPGLGTPTFPEGSFLDILPTLTATGTTTHAVEQSAAVTVLSATPTITDPDGDHLASATVQITGGTFTVPGNDSSAGDDHLTINSADRSGSDTSGTINGTSISYSYNSATELLTLTGYDTLADYQTALSEVQYFTTGDNPTDYGLNATRTITLQANDGAIGNPSGTNTTTTTLNIDAVNDAPVASAPVSYTAAERVALNLQNANLKVSDVDGGITGQNEVATLSVTEGTLTVVAGTGASSGAVIAGSGTSSVTITGTIAQINGVLNGDNTATLSFTGDIDANDTPNSTTLSLKINDNGFTGAGAPNPLTSNTATSTITAPDDTTLTFTGLSSNTTGSPVEGKQVTATITDGGLTVSTATYTWKVAGLQVQTGASNSYTPVEGDDGKTLTVDVSFNDPGNNAISEIDTGIAVGSPNTVQENPPTLTGVASTASFIEESGAVTLSPNVTVAAPGDTTLVGATVSITGGTFANDQDVLAATGNGTITASYDSANERLILSGTDTLANYQTVLDSVTFNAGENPTDYGSHLTRTVTWVLADEGSTSNLSAPATTTVSITNVNDAPILNNVATSAHFTEHGGAVTLSNAVSVIDADNLKLFTATVSITGGTFANDGDVLAATGNGTITASYDSNNERLILSGSDTLANYQTVLDSVTFNAGENPTNFGINPTRLVTWVLNDGSGSFALSAAATTTVSITNVNDAPTLSVTSANSTWTEEGANVSVISGATASDPDNLNLATATVSISGGFFAGDTLSFTNSGAVTGSYNSSTGTLVFTGSDTLATYNTMLQSVRFNGGENPTDFGSDTHRTLSWTVNDGALASAAVTATLSVVNVNDAPTLAGVPATVAGSPASTITLAPSVTVTDPDNLKLLTATVSVTGGVGDVLATNTAGTNVTASYNTTTEVLVLSGSDTLADYQTVLDKVTFSGTAAGIRTVTWVLNDGQASSSTSSPQIETIVLDNPPTLSNVAASASYTEEGATVTLSPSVTVTDPDSTLMSSATVSIAGGTFANDQDALAATTTGTSITASYISATETLVLTGLDTKADYQQVLDSVTFHAGENPTDFGSNPTRTLTWTVADDAGASSTAQTTTVSITNVNDRPTLSNVATSAAWTEEGAATTLSGSASVSDPDNLTLTSATVAITGGTFAGDGDVLATTTAGTSITASYSTSSETLTLTGSDSLAHYQQVLDSITFTAGPENPNNFGSNPTRTVTWTLNDGSGSFATSTPVTSTVSITNVNDAPTLSNVATTASYTEEGTPATLASAVSVTDPDNVKLAGATVQITGGTFAGDGDILAASTAGTSITASYNSSTETLTLSGADTLANYQSVLDHVTFAAGENPTNFSSNPTRTVTWVLNDGSASSNLSTVVTSTVSITNVNDAPTLSNVPASANYTEGGAAVTLAGAASVTDPDSLKLTGATVSITAGTFVGDGDVLAATAVGSVTVNYNAPTETLTLSGSDTLANYQQVLDSLTFNEPGNINPTNFGSNPTRTVTWVLNDGSGSFNLSTAVTETISIATVNSAPTLSNVAGTANYTENAAPVTVSPSVTVSDPDSARLANATVSISNTFAGDGDVLGFSTAGTSITASYNSTTEVLTLTGSDTLADYQQVLDSVTFSSTSDNPTDYGSFLSRVLTWVVNDGAASNNTSSPQFTTVVVTAVNDAPTLSNVPATVSFRPEHTITIAPSLAVADPDNLKLASATVAITAGSFAGDGDVLAANVAGTSVTASYNASTEVLTLTGSDTLAHYQQVLDSVTFQSGHNPGNGNSNRTRTVTWTVNDGSGSFATSTATTTIAISRPPVSNDVNGDGDSDLVFQAGSSGPFGGPVGGASASAGNVIIYLLNGTTLTSSTTLTNPSGPNFQVVADGDFNGDGKVDLVVQNSDGTPQIWFMNGATITGTVTTLPVPPASWHIIATGDFNADASPDILWQNSDGQPSIWEMNGTSIISAVGLPKPPASWRVIGTGDFDGDGHSDILWQNSNGTAAIWEMNGTSIVTAVDLPTLPPQWKVVGTGDFNADGHSDILWVNKNDNTPLIWEMNGTSVIATATLPAPPPSWTLIGTSDVNGDGKADILWQNSDGTPSVWEMNGTSIIAAVALPSPGAIWQLKDDGPIPPDQMATAAPGNNMHLSAPDMASGSPTLNAPTAANGAADPAGNAAAGLGGSPPIGLLDPSMRNSQHPMFGTG